jgi:hypothetical protein
LVLNIYRYTWTYYKGQYFYWYNILIEYWTTVLKTNNIFNFNWLFGVKMYEIWLLKRTLIRVNKPLYQFNIFVNDIQILRKLFKLVILMLLKYINNNLFLTRGLDIFVFINLWTRLFNITWNYFVKSCLPFLKNNVYLKLDFRFSVEKDTDNIRSLSANTKKNCTSFEYR